MLMKVTYEFRPMNIVEQVSFKTEGYQIINITEKIQELVILHEFRKGLVNLSILHTSASLTAVSYTHLTLPTKRIV